MQRTLRLAYPGAIGAVACSAVVLLLSGGAALAQFTDAAGGSQPYSNLKPSLTMRYLLCNQGQFPAMGDGTLWPSEHLTVPTLGEIRVVAYTNALSGFIECNGQLLPISQNTALFTILSTNFGGNGFSTFGIPDLRGTVPIGAGQGAGLPNYVRTQRVGTETITLNSSNLPSHRHTIPGGNTGLQGNTAPLSILQPSLAMNYFIDANGEIMLFAGGYTPYGWALCDGSLRQITNDNDAVLYNVIGTTYGGDGVTTFALPDLRGRSPVGTGNHALAGNYVLAQRDGVDAVYLSPALMPAHVHTIPGGATGSTGGTVPFDNRQPTLAMTWLIAYSGSAPASGFDPPYVGEMRLVAGAAPPSSSGWLPATGLVLPIGPYSLLATFIYTNYGGNGTSTFEVPNLKGRMAASRGNSFSNLGTAFDQYLVTLSTNTLPSHTHALPGMPELVGLQQFPDGAVQFFFTNVPDNTFTVLTATNMELPLSDWTPIATVTNFTAGYYQFTSAPTNEQKRFFRVGMP